MREELLSMEEEEEGCLYRKLQKLDPTAAARITPNDRRRIIRALEVCFRSSSAISEMQEDLTRPLPYDFIKIGITRDRKELYRMIEERVEQMVDRGLVDEVKRVVSSIETAGKRCGDGEQRRPLPSMQAIGYKEIAMFLHGEISLDEAIGLIKRGTKRYAKRQFTWFRKEENVHWIDLTGLHDGREAFLRIYSLLHGLLAARP